MTSLINLGHLVEQFNLDSGWTADAHIRSDGVLIKFRRHNKHLHKLISWKDIRDAKVDVLATIFNLMVKEIGCHDRMA